MAEQSQMAASSSDANAVLNQTRQVQAGQQYMAVQSLYWRQGQGKRSAPTPVHSGLTTPAEAPDADEAARMEVEADVQASAPTLLQPFSLQQDAALEVTVAALGINPSDHNAVKQWLDKPVASNRELFATMRAYHEQVIRPEMYSLIVQLETGLKSLNNSIFAIRRELSWMTAENRLAQKYACGTQILTNGWPQGLTPLKREYQIGWMLQQTPKVAAFLHERGLITDHNAHEVKRYLNALAVEPSTVPAGNEFYSSMTLLTFKAFELRSDFLEKYGGPTGSPIYTDERTSVKGFHVKVAPCSPQWQRKLESPLRVLLACINSHPDHNSTSRLTVLWKTLTLLEPIQGDDFKEDISAWARLFYFEEDGEFKGRLEICRDLEKILMAAPTETTTPEKTLWEQMWNKIQCGAQYELDQAEAAAVAKAKADASPSGKGFQLGKGKRHWSNAAVHVNYYEPFPFNLQFIVVDHIYFSWDEMCDKFKKQEHKVGDYSIATCSGKPPAPVVTDLQSQQEASQAATKGSTPTPKSKGRGRGA